MDKEISHIRKLVLPILHKYGINSVSIVGSVARGENKAGSDLDIVVEITEKISLLTFSKIKIELEETLNKKVDLIERAAIKPSLRKYLLKDEINIS